MKKEKVIEKWVEILYADLEDIFIAVSPQQEADDREKCAKLAERLWEEVG